MSSGIGASKWSVSPVTGWTNPRTAACSAWRSEARAAAFAASYFLPDPQAVILGSNLPFCNKELIDLLQTELNNNLVPVPDRYIPVNAS